MEFIKDTYASKKAKQEVPAPTPNPDRELLKELTQSARETAEEVKKLPKEIIVEKLEFPDVQKVEVTNPAPPVINLPAPQVTVEQTKVEFPEVQKVEVANLPEVKEIQKVELINEQKLPLGKGNKPGKADPSQYVVVRLSNGERFVTALEGMMASAGNASAPPFVDANGQPKRALVNAQGQLVIASGIQLTVGTMEIGTVDQGLAGASSWKVITTSGSVGTPPTTQTVSISQLVSVSGASTPVQTVFNVTSSGISHTTVDNFPTVQSVALIPQIITVSGQPVPNQTVTLTPTISGTQRVQLDNFPTVQTVNVQSIPTVQITPGITTAVSGSLTVVSVSGTDHTIVDNFPTVATVAVQNLVSVSGQPTPNQTVTLTPTISGTQRTQIDNFPTVQTVKNQDIIVSGLPHTVVDNFPTVVSVSLIPQTITVSGQPTPNQTVTLTPTISGTQRVSIDNLPTTQSVQMTASGINHTNIDNFPTVLSVNVLSQPPGGATTTTASGSITDIKNFPTVQTVAVQNLVSVSGQPTPNQTVTLTPTISGMQHHLVDNFPSTTTVSVVQNILTYSGTALAVSGTNYPSVQTVMLAPQTVTVSGQPTPNQTVTLTPTISGTQRVSIDNLPTTQSVQMTASGINNVNVDNFPTTFNIGNFSQFPTRTLVSGTDSVNVGNFPTTQTVVSVSGSTHHVQIDNFPTISTVNIANIPSSYLEDNPHTSGDAGNFVLGVRNDPGNANLTSNDLDYSPIAVTASGEVFVQRVPFGVHANIWNNAVVASGVRSGLVDTKYLPYISAFGYASAATTLTLMLSQNGTNWYEGPNVATVAGKGWNINSTIGARYVSLYTSVASVLTATIAAKG